MIDKELRLMLRHRLPKSRNKKYLQFHGERKRKGTDLHHILGQKHNDYLIAEVPHEQHIKNPNEFDFAELLIDAIEKMIVYIEFLEKNCIKK